MQRQAHIKLIWINVMQADGAGKAGRSQLCARGGIGSNWETSEWFSSRYSISTAVQG
jgi:hypothetical protein